MYVYTEINSYILKAKHNLYMRACTFYRLPGKAYTKRQHVWLTGANEVDSKTFSRAILAKARTHHLFLYVIFNFSICLQSTHFLLLLLFLKRNES